MASPVEGSGGEGSVGKKGGGHPIEPAFEPKEKPLKGEEAPAPAFAEEGSVEVGQTPKGDVIIATEYAEFKDALSEVDDFSNVVQSFDIPAKKNVRKQTADAIKNEPFVYPPKESEEASSEELANEVKGNPLFYNLPMLKFIVNGQEIQDMLSWAMMVEAERQIDAMDAERLGLVPEIKAATIAAAKVEEKSLRQQAITKFCVGGLGGGLGAGMGGKLGGGHVSMAVSTVVSSFDQAAGNAIQAVHIVPKAEEEAKKETFNAYKTMNERVYDSARENRRNMVSEVGSMIRDLIQAIGELYRSQSTLTAHKG
jgi:hypothetical protein